ncbi:formate/nitrite transporter family protein [Oceanicella sp. SM1341]|uniref:formate/nitrite transporter family protein n=1 Tax=Oceanicella sp. SM1341 TaxID=1548889 RepID=UPI000E468A06|nr:formate/nitrite transporter family protein [Oceanicella sp. SM1341]
MSDNTTPEDHPARSGATPHGTPPDLTGHLPGRQGAARGEARVRDGREEEEVRDRSRLRAPIVYEIIRRDGEDEMDRPLTSLWWSGVAAGLSIGFSPLSEALLRSHLPDTDWRPLIDNFGYAVGFLIVIMARQQLFTENTIAAVLPICANPTRRAFAKMLRLWSTVFVANIVGAMLFAAFLVCTGVLSEEMMTALTGLSEEALSPGPLELVIRGVAAGWLIASVVWILPSAENSRTLVIVLITYLIGLGEFAHVIAGSVEASVLILQGTVSIGHSVFAFLLPTLVGNILGGTALFTLLAYGQVHHELED